MKKALPWSPTNTWKRENGEWGRRSVAAHEEENLKTWSHHHSCLYLQNCHSTTQNYKIATMG